MRKFSMNFISERLENRIFKETINTNDITRKVFRKTPKKIGSSIKYDKKFNKIKNRKNKDLNINMEDLLNRKSVILNLDGVFNYILDKVVLVTGAGGSIGSEICKQLLPFMPRKIVLLGHGEYSIYNIEMELNRYNESNITEIVTEIADIQDKRKIYSVMHEHNPDIIYHAAAHKHVPLMERNPEEALKNNLIGTKNVAEAANLFNVETFVMISTDKAVNPTNVMGATKKLAEMIVHYMDRTSNTRFITVRFGNVLGSRGSVIPLFKKQIENGGPVTVTHPKVVRYFMTIPEASRLVIQAGSIAKGGEIFVLDMGEPVKIIDIANKLIELSGFCEGDIKIEFSGLRPGEKMFEELLDEQEIIQKSVYPGIYIGKSIDIDINEIYKLIEEYTKYNKNELREYLLRLTNEQKNTQETVLFFS